MVSINFSYDLLGSSRSLTPSQEVLRNGRLNSAFDLSFHELYVYANICFFGDFLYS